MPMRKRRLIRRWLPPIFLALALALAFVWRAFELERGRELVPAVPFAAANQLATYETVALDFGRGYVGDGWRLYFTEPDSARADYGGGIDEILAAAIAEARESLDIAAFALNSDVIAEAVLAAHERGVPVRIVADDEHGLDDERQPHLRDLAAAGIALVDDQRSGLMHNKFVILDDRAVWTGSWNFTISGSYRNNNNVLILEGEALAAPFRREFDEMFEAGEFGVRSTDDGVFHSPFAQGEIRIVFAPEGDELAALQSEIDNAEDSIRFMTFVFSLDELAAAMLRQAAAREFTIQGLFEARNSKASWSQMPALYCAGAQVRLDGNRYILHHKVIILDDDTVITGSFNFSASAAQRNDENIVIIRGRAIAALYLEEWRRLWDSATALPPGDIDCD